MKKTTIYITLATILLCPLSLLANNQIFGYFPNWVVYARQYTPSKIPMQDLTAVLYAFAEVGDCQPDPSNPTSTECKAGPAHSGTQDWQLHSTDEWADFQKDFNGTKGAMGAVIKLAHKQGKSVLLSVGGYSLSTSLTTAMDPTHRQAFTKSIIGFLNKVQTQYGDGFDGIDIDWEPNGNVWDQSVTTEEINNYVTFLEELKTALKNNYRSYAWLTIATPANPDAVAKIGHDNWQEITKTVNYINVMSYDYHGGFDNPKITNFNAPLSFDDHQPKNVTHRETFNINATINSYLKEGVSANKLILGLATYGRAVDGVSNTTPEGLPYAHGLYQTFTGVPQGEWDATGTFDYKYIIGQMLGRGYTDYIQAGSAAAYNESQGIWISYDNTTTVKMKTDYAKGMGLAGMMVWELSGDINQIDNPNDYDSLSLVHNIKALLNQL